MTTANAQSRIAQLERELDAANERIRELEAAQQAPTSEEAEAIARRLAECADRIGLMCSQGRPPKMSIPVRDEDDDIFISSATMTAVDLLRRFDRERQDFYMTYRMKCDEETKRLEDALAEARKLQDYTQHLESCGSPNTVCTCGLADLRAAIAREGYGNAK